MRKFIFAAVVIILLSFVFLNACKPEVTEEPGAGEIGETMESDKEEKENLLSLCEISKEMVGNKISSMGEIILVEKDNPEGKFAMLEDKGCQIGIFVPLNIWNRWDPDTRNLLGKGNLIEVWGKLTSFDGQLIIDLEGLKEQDKDIASKEDEHSKTDNGVLELPEAPGSKMLDVPLLYSGSHNIPGLCYLGAAGMLVKYNHPDLDFADIIALSGSGSSALHLNFSEMPSMLISPYMDQSVVFMIKNLNAKFALSCKAGGTGSDSFQPAELPFEENASDLVLFNSKEEAYETLKRVVGTGSPVVVYLNMYYVYDDFTGVSEYWLESLSRDHASHYMVVRGYDEKYIYFNDPTDPTEAADKLFASVDNFIQAWEMTGSIDNAPPLGPYWMIFLTESGNIPDIDGVIARNLEKAVNAPAEIRSFAEQPDDSEQTLFLLLELGNARTNFGEYLIDNGLVEAGEMYVQSGNLLTDIAINRKVDTEKILQAADLEESAIKLLQQ